MLENQVIAKALPRVSVSSSKKPPALLTPRLVATNSGCDSDPDAVAVVIVSRDRAIDLTKTLRAVCGQNVSGLRSIIVVDSSAEPEAIIQAATGFERVSIIRSAVNLGGAGAFALGLLSAIGTGASWIWLMDDDGRPADEGVLRTLLAVARKKNLAAIAPVVIDADDATRFAFPYPFRRRYIFFRREMSDDAFLASTAHLFNGMLIRSTAVFACGLPDLRLFIRGDEIDFMYRMRRAGLRFGTTATASFLHPSSNSELYSIWGGRLHVVYPQIAWKRRCQYRNRAYNFLRHGRWLIMAVDALRYPYFFLVHRRGDVAGLKEWLGCSWLGLRGKLAVDPEIDLTPVRDSEAAR